jgi:hypothetical protein
VILFYGEVIFDARVPFKAYIRCQSAPELKIFAAGLSTEFGSAPDKIENHQKYMRLNRQIRIHQRCISNEIYSNFMSYYFERVACLIC